MPASEDMPSTLQRSPKRAQEVWAKAHDSAVETYGEGEPAHRTAFSALKHQFQKAGDHWEPRTERARRIRRPAAVLRRRGHDPAKPRAAWMPTHPRVTCTRPHEIGVRGRSRMSNAPAGDAD